MRPRIALLLTVALVAGLMPLAQSSLAQEAPAEPPEGRETEAVVLTGANLPEWSTLGDVALKANSVEGAQCEGVHDERVPDQIDERLSEELRNLPDTPITSGPDKDPCTHNQYEDPEFQTSDYVPPANATPVDQVLGYRWTGSGFEQIPFQVDEMFVRYLSNNDSGFSFYSETDQHTSYAFDREGFRWTASDPNNPCLAQPASELATDPVAGLDTDDEVVFMRRDAGERAPVSAGLPPGIEDSYEIAVTDAANQDVSFVYLMKAASDGPKPAFTKDDGYVRYQRDADANTFLFSESSYENYGAAPKGPWYDPETGICHSAEAEWKQHRPGDQATITTPRYRFRYEGRWLMTELGISKSEDGDWTYEDDVIDQWKARAFQQRPGGQTPCCGYEEEVNNWGGSSILMGERSGPVRTIRETWGADSGTNVVRREIFYRDEIRFISFLRVHVIPPADGIYAQWDYNADIMTRYYNPQTLDSEGVKIDGKNDDVGNTHVYASYDGLAIDPDGEGPQGEIGPGGQEKCPHDGCINNDIDVPDPVFSGVNAGLNWEQITGPHGTLVVRSQIHKATPGSAHSVLAVPYYRDDACFDDGTGSNPGPHIDGRNVDGDEPSDSTYVAPDGSTRDRRCWDSETDPSPPPEGDPQYYQGSIGTHGVHILLIADSDNAHTTLPLTEIDSDQRMVILPGEQANVGNLYGRAPEKPLIPIVIPEVRQAGTQTATPTSSPTGSPSGTPSPTQTPQKQTTTLELTEDTDAAGQFSDPATFAAKLTKGTEPLVGEDVTFELTGADGTTSWTAPTGADGVATKTVTIDRAPGSYQLVARYDGDETSLASADQAPFAVEKEDTNLALRVSGNNSKRTLIATLIDRDNGAGLANKRIEFFDGGTSLGSATTNSDGVATKEGVRAGNRSLEARFTEDDYHLASSAQQRG